MSEGKREKDAHREKHRKRLNVEYGYMKEHCQNNGPQKPWVTPWRNFSAP